MSSSQGRPEDLLLPPVVVEALTRLTRYAEGGYRCRLEGDEVEVVEYVPRRDAALRLVDGLARVLVAPPPPPASAVRPAPLRLAA